MHTDKSLNLYALCTQHAYKNYTNHEGEARHFIWQQKAMSGLA